MMKEKAIKLMHEWVLSESLRKHCYAVAAAMEKYAEHFKEDKDKWFVCGLLHDFDYERFPSLDKHPYEGCKVLRELGYDKEIITSIMGHGNHTGIKRESLMAKALFAVDELCGLIVALSKVRVGRFDGMTSDSVEKVMKKKEFAAAISREDIEKGIVELGIDRKEHFERVISALKECKYL